MQGDPDIISALNEVLTSELTAINQYFVHYKMCENWGYHKLAQHFRKESIEEMQHADQLIDRILYLDGIPNMQRLSPVKVGEDVAEQVQVDLALEQDAVARLNRGIALCLERHDAGSRELLERILLDEEEAIDWGEAQVGVIETIGIERYLAEHMIA